MHFGDLFKQYMQEKRRTDQQIADLSGVPKFTIVSWREGRTKKPRNVPDLLEVAKALNLSLNEGDQLLGSAGHATISERIAIAHRDQNESELDLFDYWISQIATGPSLGANTESTQLTSSNKKAQFQAPPTVENFTGREQIIDDIEQYFLNEEGRIASLVGMGGVGKTSIAIVLAYRLRDHFPDGVFWIDLKHLAERRDDIENSLSAHMLSIIQEFAPGFEQAGDIHLLSAQLRNILANNHLLLIVDNVESFDQVTHFLPPSWGGSKMLVTTRRKLISQDDAQDFEVASFTQTEAITFLQRKVSNRRLALEQEQANTLCEFLGYLPLAIQIVASDLAETHDITIAEYLDLLVDEKERLVEDLENASRSVRATFELSYKRLPNEHRPLFANLIIFNGIDFSSEAVTVTFGLSSIKAKRLLSYLHRASLLEKGRPALDKGGERYQFHPLLKQFAREKLSKFSTLTPQFHLNAARYYLDLAYEHRFGQFDILGYEWENCIEGILWGIQVKNADLVLQGIEGLTAIRLGLFGFLDSRAHWRDGAHLIQDILKKLIDRFTTEQIGILKIKLGAFYFRMGRLDQAKGEILEALKLLQSEESSETLDWKLSEMYAADMISRISLERNEELEEVMTWSEQAANILSTKDSNEFTRAEAGYGLIRHAEMLGRMGQVDEGLANAKKGLSNLPDTPSGASAVGHMVMGTIHYYLGQSEQALCFWEKGLEIAESVGDLRRSLIFNFNLALVSSYRGDFKHSISIQTTAIEAFEKMGEISKVALNMSNVAEDLIFAGKLTHADSYLQKALKITEEYGLNEIKLRIIINLFQLSLVLCNLDEARVYEEEINQFFGTVAFQESQDEIIYHRARLRLIEGELSQATTYVIGLLNNHKSSSHERCRYLRLLGDIYAFQGLIEKSEDLFLEGLDVCQSNSYRYELAETQLTLGKSLLARGVIEEGKNYLDNAALYYKDQEISPKLLEIESAYKDYR